MRINVVAGRLQADREVVPGVGVEVPVVRVVGTGERPHPQRSREAVADLSHRQGRGARDGLGGVRGQRDLSVRGVADGELHRERRHGVAVGVGQTAESLEGVGEARRERLRGEGEVHSRRTTGVRRCELIVVPGTVDQAVVARRGCGAGRERLVELQREVVDGGLRVGHTGRDDAVAGGVAGDPEGGVGRRPSAEARSVIMARRVRRSQAAAVVELVVRHQASLGGGRLLTHVPLNGRIGASDVPDGEVVDVAVEIGPAAEVGGVRRAQGVVEGGRQGVVADRCGARAGHGRRTGNAVEHAVQGRGAAIVAQGHEVPGAETDRAQVDAGQVPDACFHLAVAEDLELAVVPARVVNGGRAELVQDDPCGVRLEPELEGDRRVRESAMEVGSDQIVVGAVERESVARGVVDCRPGGAENAKNDANFKRLDAQELVPNR